MAGKMGEWSFVIGIVLAILLGFVPSDWLGMATLVLVVLGLLVGFLNITEKETTPFLVASIALLATSNAAGSLGKIPPEALGRFLVGAVYNIAAFVAPAAIVVAIKAIWALAKD